MVYDNEMNGGMRLSVDSYILMLKIRALQESCRNRVVLECGLSDMTSQSHDATFEYNFLFLEEEPSKIQYKFDIHSSILYSSGLHDIKPASKC